MAPIIPNIPRPHCARMRRKSSDSSLHVSSRSDLSRRSNMRNLYPLPLGRSPLSGAAGSNPWVRERTLDRRADSCEKSAASGTSRPTTSPVAKRTSKLETAPLSNARSFASNNANGSVFFTTVGAKTSPLNTVTTSGAAADTGVEVAERSSKSHLLKSRSKTKRE